MIAHAHLSSIELKKMFRRSQIGFAGNNKLKIYGTVHCASGKRMRKENRVFFKNEKEAITEGFRPCGHCLKESYTLWKIKNSIFKIQN
jgi:methylphosphotriester-DNA--protein-cysteine methyltransferase